MRPSAGCGTSSGTESRTSAVASTSGRAPAEESLRHYKLAGYDYPVGRSGLATALASHGPRPADEALQTLDAALPTNPDPWALLRRAGLLRHACAVSTRRGQSRFRRARGCVSSSRTTRGGNHFADIAALAGDHESAARYLQRACDRFERQSSWALLSTYAPALGRSLCALGRYDEAEPLAQRGRELGDEDDLVTQALWRQVQALVHAHRGEHAEAERLAREAISITERMDGLNYQGDVLCDLAEVLAAAGRTDEAADALEQALERYGRKKNLAMVAQVTPRLEKLRAGVS